MRTFLASATLLLVDACGFAALPVGEPDDASAPADGPAIERHVAGDVVCPEEREVDAAVAEVTGPNAVAPIDGFVPPSPVVPPQPFLLDSCEETDFADAELRLETSPHLDVRYLEGSPVEADLADFVARREAAYAGIRAALGVTTEPRFELVVAPSRLAAAAHGLDLEHLDLAARHADLVYPGAADAFEATHVGNVLAHLLLAERLGPDRRALGILDAGIAELFDGTRRDLHRAYGDRLSAGVETRVYVAELEDSDAAGRNPGRAGSLVQSIVERHGLAGLRALVDASACAVDSCPTSGAAVEAVLDAAADSALGLGWAELRAEWLADLSPYLEAAPSGLEEVDLTAVLDVVVRLDTAAASDDATAYRAGLEGYYCDRGGEVDRVEVAERNVEVLGSLHTSVLAVIATGTASFPAAVVIALRHDANGTPILGNLTFEHFPVGWRLTSSPEWR